MARFRAFGVLSLAKMGDSSCSVSEDMTIGGRVPVMGGFVDARLLRTLVPLPDRGTGEVVKGLACTCDLETLLSWLTLLPASSMMMISKSITEETRGPEICFFG